MDVPSIVTAVVLLGAGLLVLAGALKVPVPDAAMATLHRLHLPSGRIAARALGLGEVTIGVGVVIVGGRVAPTILAAVYALLLGVASWQRAAQVDCGCFGTTATVVTRTHLATNAVFAALGLAGAVVGTIPLGTVAADAGVLGTLAGVVLLVTAVGLLRAVLVRAADATVASSSPAVLRSGSPA